MRLLGLGRCLVIACSLTGVVARSCPELLAGEVPLHLKADNPVPSDTKLGTFPADPRTVIREDWYLRESLRAIQDWETILARWEPATPDELRTPILPVPSNGEAVLWPNPIPRRLLPWATPHAPVRVRAVHPEIEVRRGDAQGPPGRIRVKPGAEVEGYQHPGGGGKDQWYHRYTRRFDRLTSFRPRPAALALEWKSPTDFRRGVNPWVVTVRNVGDGPLRVGLQLDFHGPKESRRCAQQELSLTSRATEQMTFRVELADQGGGILTLRADAGGEVYWLPMLTHVEDVSAVLPGVQQILADEPSPEGARRLTVLNDRAARWRTHGAADSGEQWSELFEQLCALRDELLLGRIGFKELLFVKRKPFFSEQPFMDAHHLYNRPGGGVYRLSPVRPDGKLTAVIDDLGEGVYRDVCLHWDAKKFLFAFGNGSDSWSSEPNYRIFEAAVDGGARRRLTGPVAGGKGSAGAFKNDCEPFYLPDGQIGFTSDRSEHFVMCGADRHAANLFVMGADGSGIRQLSFNVFNDFNPTMLPDGRILYSRWEYNERSVTSLHNPFTMNPDGTMVSPLYGNATIRPNVVMFPRPVPGSHKLIALFTAHHGQTHGAVGLIDPRRGVDGPEPLELLTPGVPVTGEKAEDSRHGWFSDPVPLGETTWLCSYTPTVVPWLEWTWALYVADRHGNLALVYRDPQISCAEPVPLVPRSRPHVLPSPPADTDRQDAEAALVLADAHVGLPGVPRGTPRFLRVIEDVPRKGVHQGGVICTSGTRVYTIKRILGTVPIEADGSAHFCVPANRNVYFEVLDQQQREIQRMRSVVCLKPGENRSCIGCHEPRQTAPPHAAGRPARLALTCPASRPQAPPWGTQILSFLRDVQPVLNARCVRCHTHDRNANRVILTDDLTDRFTVGYEELLPYVSAANAMRWDHPDDVYARPPYTYGSAVSRLTRLLEAGHHDLALTEEERLRLVNWIDANAVYYDRYEADAYPNRRIFSGEIRKKLDEVLARRCHSCHGKGDGQFDTWALSINRHDVRRSRALAAPLTQAAGGWGRCDGPVFADAGDPDYQALLEAFGQLDEALRKRPREDLLSIRGTPAESQRVEIPPAPKPAPRSADLAAEGWVYLSDLPWESARAGWTPNKDGLPRRDKDIEDHPLRLDGRRFRKGIGTHAPSEIVYRLDGRYARLLAQVGGAEASGSVVFEVYGDDNLLFRSRVMRGLQGAEAVDVPLTGVQRLRLVVTDAGDGIIADMANWAEARVQRPRE